MPSPHVNLAMEPVLLAGSANQPLATAIAGALGVQLHAARAERFPDGELHLELSGDVHGRDAFIVQSLCPPSDQYLLEFLLVADAASRAGARTLTAVLPYLAYARQDRRTSGREALGARVVADLLQVAPIHRVIAVDLHSPPVEGFFRVPVEHLSAFPLFAEALLGPDGFGPGPARVVVSPDLGGVKRALWAGKLLDLPVAIVHKRRLNGREVTVHGLVGAVRGLAPILVDDMISTGGTLEAAVAALLDAGCSEDITIAATHGLFVGDALERLARLPIRALLTTDTVPPAPPAPPGQRPLPFPVRRLTVAPLIADAVGRLSG
jgi:ribose-phosphate pyrophosphokinase